MKPLTELIGIQRLMALSIKEPYGSLILSHGKKETRTWATNYKGYVLLCASKSPYQAQSILEISGPEQTQRICDALGTADLNKLNRFNGHAFAVALLAGCRPMMPSDENDCFVKYYGDLFCWEFEKAYEIVPFPWTGSQGLKIVPHETIDKIMLK